MICDDPYNIFHELNYYIDHIVSLKRIPNDLALIIVYHIQNKTVDHISFLFFILLHLFSVHSVFQRSHSCLVAFYHNLCIDHLHLTLYHKFYRTSLREPPSISNFQEKLRFLFLFKIGMCDNNPIAYTPSIKGN